MSDYVKRAKIFLILILICVFGITGCDKKNTNETDNLGSKTTSEKVTTSMKEPTTSSTTTSKTTTSKKTSTKKSTKKITEKSTKSATTTTTMKKAGPTLN